MTTTQIRGWAGVFPAAMTHFAADGRLDEQATGDHFQWLISSGAHGLVVAGTSGEFILLENDERRRVIELAISVANGRVPIVAGTGYASTAATIGATEWAARAGADAAIVILPYYLRPTPHEVIGHFEAVGRASSIPIVVYNNPANSAAPELSVEDLRVLYNQGLIAGVKSTFPTVHQIHELKAAVDPPFRAFYGSFNAPLEAMAGGADGWISGILNVATPEAVRLWDAIQASDLEAARGAWRAILPIKLLYTSGRLGRVSDLALYRTILRLRGFDAGASRAPVLDLNPGQVELVRATIDSLTVVAVR